MIIKIENIKLEKNLTKVMIVIYLYKKILNIMIILLKFI